MTRDDSTEAMCGAHPYDGESSANEVLMKTEPQNSREPMNRTAYLGMRRDGQGRWARRHFSQKRFPHLAKSVPTSPSCRSLAPVAAQNENHKSTVGPKPDNNDKEKVEISNERRALFGNSARAYEDRKQKTSPVNMEQKSEPSSAVTKSQACEESEQQTSASERIQLKHASSNPPLTARRSPVPYEFTGELPSLSESYSYNEELAQISTPKSISEQLTTQSIKSTDETTPTKGGKRRKKKKKHKVVFENTPKNLGSTPLEKNMSTLELEDEISGLFTTRTGDSSSRISSIRRKRAGSSSTSFVSTEEEERIRRFEEAYRAIMLATYQDNDEATIISSEWINSGGKRWSRDPNISSAVSVDGRVYDDLQRGPTVSRRGMLSSPDIFGNLRCREPLLDRGATWMVHVPRVKPSKTETVKDKDETSSPSRGRGSQREKNNRNVLLSPCQKKLSDIEQRVQKSAIRPKLDLAQNRKAVAQGPNEGHSKMVSNIQQSKATLGVTAETSSSKPPGCNNSVRQASISEVCTTPSQSTTKATGKTKSCHDNTDVTPQSTVRTSTLRRLFSGITDTPDNSKLNTPDAVKRTGVKVMREMFENQHKSSSEARSPRSDPIASIFGRQSRSSVEFKHAQPKSGETLATPVGSFGPGRSSPSFLARVRDTFTVDSDEPENDSGSNRQSDTQEFNIQSSDPPDAMSATLRKLDVTNLIRYSLSQKEDGSIIDTDGTATDITGGFDEKYHMDEMGSLLMSPALLTKRYIQALEAIEQHNWEQVSYLINADPWLMEMKDLRNDQYLLHALALFGAGQHDEDDETVHPAPRELIEAMLEHDPYVVHKLDNEGNLPLHMAAASGNITMIRELGLRFPSAASVQNHDGFLPLHLAIMSCALFPTGEQAVSLILALFHGGVCVKDNEGNIPLHTAARTLKGDVGVDVIHQLMSVCNKLARENPIELKESMGGNVKKPKYFDDTATTITTTTGPFTDTSGLEDCLTGSLFCVAKNNSGDTPLAIAIKSLAGWQVIEALLNTNGGYLAVFEKNSAAQTALHLALEIDFNDASVVLAILKAAPSAAPIADGAGVIPIQLACTNCLPREIILAISIIDLPIDLGARQEEVLRNGFGASWWFLVCESDDRYVDIVTEILLMCSHPQKTALCLTRATHYGSNKTVISCATQQCKLALLSSLRFLGRFEFSEDEERGFRTPDFIQQFKATDFGTQEHPLDKERKVSLRCYMNDVEYIRETRHLNQIYLPENLFEDLEFFSLDEDESITPEDIQVKHCVSMATPSMTLARVVAGMPKDHEYRKDANSLGRYCGKVKHVLLQTAKALSHLHESAIVHGSVDSYHIGKFKDGWKLTGLLDSVAQQCKLPSRLVGLHCPPEAYSNDSSTASPAHDVWSFGKLMYEVFVGESLFAPFQEEGREHITIISWNERHQSVIADELFGARVGSTGIDLITRCLYATVEDRLGSMTFVLQHPFWKDENAFAV